MISTPDRKRAVELVKETVAAGARTFKVCEQMGLSMRTYQRWSRQGGVKADGRPDAVITPTAAADNARSGLTVQPRTVLVIGRHTEARTTHIEERTRSPQ